MNENARALFLCLQDVPITDRYASPCLPKGVLTNAIELLKTPQKDRIISLLSRGGKENISTLSDFEYMKRLFGQLPAWIGTREGALLPYEMAILFGKSMGTEDFSSREFLKSAWDIGREKLLDVDGKYENLLRKNAVEKLYNRTPFDNGSTRVEKYNNEADKISLLCDFRGLPFCRPDPYHATCVEEKQARGETLTSEEQSLLAAQALYRVCTDGKKNIELRLLADADGTTATELICYLKRQSARGTLWIAADGCMSVDVLTALCDMSDDTLEIRPEIVLGPYDLRYNFEQRLHLLAARYPIACWRFGGVLGTDPLFFAGHTYAREVICSVIVALVEDQSVARSLVRQIFASV